MLPPGADDYLIPDAKLRAYALNPTHQRGRHKARKFVAALGLGPSDVEFFTAQIEDAVNRADVNWIYRRVTSRGKDYSLDFRITTDAGSAVIRTNWIIKPNTKTIRLTSCFIK